MIVDCQNGLSPLAGVFSTVWTTVAEEASTRTNRKATTVESGWYNS
jgi:hypothetical protein